jgi:hypothetical protein
MKAAASITTATQYLASLPEPRRSELTALHKAIRKAVPGLKPGIAYGMIGYGSYHYRYASGREGDAPVIGLASQKQYISLYISCCGEAGYLPEKNKHRLGKVSCGKCCIRFKRLEDLKLGVALRLVKRAAKFASAAKYQYVQ